jgi:hypothetical protein
VINQAGSTLFDTNNPKNLSDFLSPRPSGYHDDSKNPAVDYEKLSGDRLGETSETIRKRAKLTETFTTSDFRFQAAI